MIQSNDGGVTPEAGSQVLFTRLDRTTANLIVRLRLPDGGYGPRTEHLPSMRRATVLQLPAGSEVTVVLDHESGEVRGIDVEATEDEHAAGDEVALAAQAERSTLRGQVSAAAAGLAEAVADLRAGDPPADTVEGVTVDNWLAMRQVLAATGGRLPPEVLERSAKAYGVPAGRWEAVDAEWSRRAAADPQLAARVPPTS